MISFGEIVRSAIEAALMLIANVLASGVAVSIVLIIAYVVGLIR
jgi:hypothetical protein